MQYASHHARRLYWILEDLGYETGGSLDLAWAARVIARRSHRSFTRPRLVDIMRGAKLSADDAVTIADGLGVDVRELLYDDGAIPPSRRRPINPLDELEVM